MPPLEAIQTIIGGGATVLLGVAIWALYSGRVRVGSLTDKREAELKEERDEWKKLAQSFPGEMRRLGDLVEQAIDLLGPRHTK